MRFILYIHIFLLFPLFANAYIPGDAIVSGHVSFVRQDASLKNVYICLIGPLNFQDRSGSLSHLYTTYTDSAGFYEFKNLYAGKYTLTCYSNCNHCFPDVCIRDTIQFKESQVQEHNFLIDELALDPSFVVDSINASISGHLTDENADATNKQIRINILQLDRKYPHKAELRTDSLGNYRFDHLCGGKYMVTCHPTLGAEAIIAVIVVKPGQTVVEDFNVRVKDKRELHNDKKSDNLLVGNVNFHFGWRPMGELSLGLGHSFPTYRLTTKWETIQLGTEFNFSRDHFMLGPKLSYNYSQGFLFVAFNLGGSFIYYTDFSDGALYFNPHFGVGIQTILDLYLGYNIPLTGKSFGLNEYVSQLTFTLAFPILNRHRLDM